MSQGRESLFSTEYEIVYTVDEIEPGDFVAYPGMCRSQHRRPHEPDRGPRDWIEVRRIERGHVIGVRVNPLDWEIAQEYHVYPAQLADHGVALVKMSVVKGRGRP